MDAGLLKPEDTSHGRDGYNFDRNQLRVWYNVFYDLPLSVHLSKPHWVELAHGYVLFLKKMVPSFLSQKKFQSLMLHLIVVGLCGL